MFNDTLAIALKELQLLFKDKGSLAVFFLMPLLFAVIMGGPAQLVAKMEEGSGDGEQALVMPIYMVNEDPGPYGAQVAEALLGVEMLEITTLTNAGEADQLVADGEAPAAVIIPANFSDKIETNEATRVLIITDPTQEEMADIVSGVVNQATAEIGILGELQYGIRAVLEEAGTLEGAGPELRAAVEAQTLGVIWTQVQEMRQNPIISVRSEDMEGEETEGSWNPVSYTIPAFAVMFAFFLVVFIAEQLLLEKESGSFRRLMASPIHRGGIIGGKLLAYVIVVFVQVALLFAVGAVFFKIPMGNSPLGLFLITLATALAAVSLGLLVGSLAKTSKQANQIGMVLGFVMMGIGGCIFPFFKEEGFIGILSRLTPHAHAVEAYMRLMIDGYGVLQVLTNLAMLIGFAFIFLVLAVWRFRFE